MNILNLENISKTYMENKILRLRENTITSGTFTIPWATTQKPWRTIRKH